MIAVFVFVAALASPQARSVRLTGLMAERDRGWSQWSCRGWAP